MNDFPRVDIESSNLHGMSRTRIPATVTTAPIDPDVMVGKCVPTIAKLFADVAT